MAKFLSHEEKDDHVEVKILMGKEEFKELGKTKSFILIPLESSKEFATPFHENVSDAILNLKRGEVILLNSSRYQLQKNLIRFFQLMKMLETGIVIISFDDTYEKISDILRRREIILNEDEGLRGRIYFIDCTRKSVEVSTERFIKIDPKDFSGIAIAVERFLVAAKKKYNDVYLVMYSLSSAFKLMGAGITERFAEYFSKTVKNNGAKGIVFFVRNEARDDLMYVPSPKNIYRV